jgi:hypothetical protein
MAAPEEAARYFVDETDYAAGAALAKALAPVVHPGHPELPEVPRGTDDLDWIPVVAEMGLVVITRDKLKLKAEWEAFNEHGLRVIRISAEADQSVWATVRLIAAAWGGIEALVQKEGPGPWLAGLDGGGKLTLVLPGPAHPV